MPTPTPQPQVIVELGAGDYSNAIAMKKANPDAHVIATNLVEEWEAGKRLYERGETEEWLARVYKGWLDAQVASVDVGATRPYENADVPSGVGDLVYTILPYPHIAYQFGIDAARIAGVESGTTVAITEGQGHNAAKFIAGFQWKRPGSQFVPIPGALYGAPGELWESGPYVTWQYTVP